MIPGLISLSRACAQLSVSPETLRRRLEEHRLEVVRVGRYVYLNEVTFNELIRLCTEVYKRRGRRSAHDIRKDNLAFFFMGDDDDATGHGSGSGQPTPKA